MFRPSSRRKSAPQEITLNLVPILDALVTLIAFLLFSSAFLAIVVIDTPAPLLAPASEQVEKMKEKPLQLTAAIQQNQIVITDWTGSREAHTIPNTIDPKTSEPRYDLEKFHQTLVSIKSRHPQEVKLILKPESGVSYESLVGIMDSARAFEKTDSPLYKRNEQGVDEPETKLFPEILFGNIMS
jgi:biopolymer transport protein ExbD